MASFELELAPLGHAPASDGSEAPALLIGQLYEQHFRMVRALCQLLLRNTVDAEDAAQQTFLSAFGSLIDGTVPELPAPWLATIARRECWARTAQRRRQPLALDETNAPASAADNPLDEAIRNVDLAALWRAIDVLPRQQRTAFLMREFSGLSYAEVAEALGASESAIESLLVRARRQLRDGLEPVIRTANLVLTPVVLLQHGLWRLFGERKVATGAAATAGIPAAAKLGTALAGAVAVGAVGVGVGVGTGVLHGRTTPHHAALELAAQPAGANALTSRGALERLIGRSNAGKLFPLASSWGFFESTATDATAVRGAEPGASGTPGDLTPVGPGPTAPDPTGPDPTGPDPTGPDPTGRVPAPSDTPPGGSPDPAPMPAASGADPTSSGDAGDPAATDTASTETTPADTTPDDTTPADEAPFLDPTPAVDPATTDGSPAADPAPTEPADTTAP
jgi:RNA polymerase sigma-70 factor (ECF subfamily)